MANIYPSWWNVTLTVFNRYEDPLTNLITWYKHTVEDCFWKDIGNKITVGETILETNDIICRIRKNPLFLEKYQWVNLPADEKPNYFTIGKDDIIIKGEVDDEINEYATGTHSSDIIRKYKELQGCLTVTECTINTEGGRCNEHYYIKGE